MLLIAEPTLQSPRNNFLSPEILKPFGFRIKTPKEPTENEPRPYLPVPLLRPVRWHSLNWMGKRDGEGYYRRNWGKE